MKINQIIVNESSVGTTTAGNFATVESPMGTVQKRIPTQKTTKKKGPYANSLTEGKVKELSMDLSSGKDGLPEEEFKKKYGKTKAEMRKAMKEKPEPAMKVDEADLHEEDKIIPVGKGKKLKTGLHGKDEEPKFKGLKPPFMARGVFVADKRGNKVCDCDNEMLAQQVAKALTAYAIANEAITSGGVVASGMPGESVELDEKAVSKAQQRFMGMAHAIQKGKKIPDASQELKSVAKGMTKKAAHDFAATKHKGLPEKVKKKD